MKRTPTIRRSVRWVIYLIVALAAIQLVRIHRDNPPAGDPLSAPSDVAQVLDRSCYDCHSNATTWPWYSHVAPVSWLVGHDVHEGRQHLNFSTWGDLPPNRQAELAREAWKEVREGDMPPITYRAMHPRARLSDADRRTIEAWSESVAGPAGGVTGSP